MFGEEFIFNKYVVSFCHLVVLLSMSSIVAKVSLLGAFFILPFIPPVLIETRVCVLYSLNSVEKFQCLAVGVSALCHSVYVWSARRGSAKSQNPQKEYSPTDHPMITMQPSRNTAGGK